jgi:hypothetical protein
MEEQNVVANNGRFYNFNSYRKPDIEAAVDKTSKGRLVLGHYLRNTNLYFNFSIYTT